MVRSWGQIGWGRDAGQPFARPAGSQSISSSRTEVPLRLWTVPAEWFLSLFLLLFLLVFLLLVQDSSSVPLPAFLVAGGSLAFGTLLCIGVVLR